MPSQRKNNAPNSRNVSPARNTRSNSPVVGNKRAPARQGLNLASALKSPRTTQGSRTKKQVNMNLGLNV